MMCRLPAKVSLDVFEMAGRDQLVHALYEIGHGYIEAIEAGAGNSSEILFPDESGTQLLKLSGGHLVIDLVGIAPLHSIHCSLRQLGFEGRDGPALPGRCRQSPSWSLWRQARSRNRTALARRCCAARR